MKKILFVLLLAPLFSYAETVIHENSMCFSGLSLTGYNNVTLNIPGDQQDSTRAEDGTQVEVNGNCIDVYAGRHNSSSVKDWAKTQMENTSSKWEKQNMTAYQVSEEYVTTPDKLNFAINGDLSFSYSNHDYVCKSITFGQGNTSQRNNWWVFSNGDFSSQQMDYGYARIDCTDTATSEQSQFYLHTTGYDSFEFMTSQPAAGPAGPIAA